MNVSNESMISNSLVKLRTQSACDRNIIIYQHSFVFISKLLHGFSCSFSFHHLRVTFISDDSYDFSRSLSHSFCCRYHLDQPTFFCLHNCCHYYHCRHRHTVAIEYWSVRCARRKGHNETICYVSQNSICFWNRCVWAININS